MCLHVKKYSRAQIAKKDIICYKMLYSNSNGGAYSPFWFYDYEFGKKCDGVLGKKSYMTCMSDDDYRVYVGFHSFKNKTHARLLSLDYNCDVYECIIPKGSQYYVGTFYDCPCYASDSIIVKKHIRF